MAVTTLGLYGGPRGVIPPPPAVPTALVTGTLVTSAVETNIVDGGTTIVITLTDDTWVSAGATFNAQRQAIIDGLDSAQSEANGWNVEVRDKEVVGAVVRTSPTVVTITLSAAPLYAIEANEDITITVPASALTGTSPIIASPVLTVRPDSSLGHVAQTLRHQDTTLRHQDATLRHSDNTLAHHQ